MSFHFGFDIFDQIGPYRHNGYIIDVSKALGTGLWWFRWWVEGSDEEDAEELEFLSRRMGVEHVHDLIDRRKGLK